MTVKKQNTVDVELCLISSVLLSSDMKTPLSFGITQELFEDFKDEWKWISEYYIKNAATPTDVAFSNRFPALANQLYETKEVKHWAEQVVEEYRARSLLGAIHDALTDLDNGTDPLSAAGTITSTWRDVVINTTGTNDNTEIISSWEGAYNEALERSDRVEKDGFAGIPTGFPDIDAATGGLQSQWLTVVGGRLGSGKTMTMLRMAWEAVWQGHRVLYLSLEQSASQIAYRIHSFASHQISDGKETINSLDLVRGTGFQPNTYRNLLQNIEQNTNGELFVNDTSRGRITPDILASLINDKKPDIVFVDYLTLMQADGFKENWQRASYISGQLKMLASQNEIPIVVGSQLNRSGIGGSADNEHLAGSDSVGQDADLVLLVSDKSHSVKKLRVSKFRHGPDNISILCEYRPGRGIFEQVTSTKAEQLIESDAMTDF